MFSLNIVFKMGNVINLFYVVGQIIPKFHSTDRYAHTFQGGCFAVHDILEFLED